jgi:hypothetical protein
MKNENTNPQNKGEIILYQSEDGSTKLEVALQNETVWLTQTQMAKLFTKDVRTINEHIQNIFSEGELETDSTIRKFRIVRKEGNREVLREIEFYNLDVIISVGYRVRSHRGTQFRIWATKKLKEFIIKGFVMDDERLSEGGSTKSVYFDELLERVRKIRTSEKNFYEKVRAIFATSIDYDSKTEFAKEFFSTVQNKFHYAVTGLTASELIVKRINSSKDSLGLTSFKGLKPTSEEAKIAKNYLEELELKQLELLVEQFLSYGELQVLRKKSMYMVDWIKKLDNFLELNDFSVLKDKGNISHKEMIRIVKEEIQAYGKKIHKLKTKRS